MGATSRSAAAGGPLPAQVKDRFLLVALEWSGGCLWCGGEVVEAPLPGSDGLVRLPLCGRHVRWAMASRREGMGKQNRILKGYLAAWCRVHGGDREAAMAWLEAGRRHGR